MTATPARVQPAPGFGWRFNALILIITDRLTSALQHNTVIDASELQAMCQRGLSES